MSVILKRRDDAVSDLLVKIITYLDEDCMHKLYIITSLFIMAGI